MHSAATTTAAAANDAATAATSHALTPSDVPGGGGGVGRRAVHARQEGAAAALSTTSPETDAERGPSSLRPRRTFSPSSTLTADALVSTGTPPEAQSPPASKRRGLLAYLFCGCCFELPSAVVPAASHTDDDEVDEPDDSSHGVAPSSTPSTLRCVSAAGVGLVSLPQHSPIARPRESPLSRPTAAGDSPLMRAIAAKKATNVGGIRSLLTKRVAEPSRSSSTAVAQSPPFVLGGPGFTFEAPETEFAPDTPRQISAFMSLRVVPQPPTGSPSSLSPMASPPHEDWAISPHRRRHSENASKEISPHSCLELDAEDPIYLKGAARQPLRVNELQPRKSFVFPLPDKRTPLPARCTVMEPEPPTVVQDHEFESELELPACVASPSVEDQNRAALASVTRVNSTVSASRFHHSPSVSSTPAVGMALTSSGFPELQRQSSLSARGLTSSNISGFSSTTSISRNGGFTASRGFISAQPSPLPSPLVASVNGGASVGGASLPCTSRIQDLADCVFNQTPVSSARASPAHTPLSWKQARSPLPRILSPRRMGSPDLNTSPPLAAMHEQPPAPTPKQKQIKRATT